jgi:hypothetical protein
VLREALSVGIMVVALSFAWLAAGVREAVLGIRDEVRAARADAVSEIRATRDAAIAEIRATRAELRAELKVVRKDLRSEVGGFRLVLDRRLEGLERQVERGLTSMEGELAVLRADASRVLQSTNRMVELVTPQVLGLTAASKVTAGELAQTARTWRRETPAIAENVREATANVRQATKLSKWQKLLLLGAAAAAVVGVAK